jgi:hypothetical protein
MIKESACYRRLDFVEYFACVTGVTREQTGRLASNAKCLAILEAFMGWTLPVKLAQAIWYVADDMQKLFPEFGEIGQPDRHGKTISLNRDFVAVFLHAARCLDLPREDPRSIQVGDDIKRRYADLFPRHNSVKCGNGDIDATGIDFNAQFDALKYWQEINSAEESEYFSYWSLANQNALTALLCDRKFLAMMDAYIKGFGSADGPYFLGMLEEVFGSLLPTLESRLRPAFFSSLEFKCRRNLLEMPNNLFDEFPDLYSFADEPVSSPRS